MSENKSALNTVADGMAAARIVASPFIAGYLAMTSPEERNHPLVTGGVAVLSASDFADGRIARIAGATERGAKLDEWADKAFVGSSWLAMAITGEIPPVHAGLKLARDVSVTALRSRARANGQSASVGNTGKQKTTIEMMTLTAANSPLAENKDLIRTGLSISTALSLQSFVGYAAAYTKKPDSEKPAKAETSARNGLARKLATDPVNKLVSLIDQKAPYITPDHLTMAGETLVEASVLYVAAKPNKVVVPTILYTAGSLLDGLDGSLARLKSQSTGGSTTVEGMIKDVRADKRQEIVTLTGLSLIARQRNNNVAANNYAVGAMTTVLSALFRAKAETNGHLSPEDAFGSRVVTGILGGVGLALNKHQDISDILSASVVTGKVNTSLQRRDVAKQGQDSPYSQGINTDPEFAEHAKIRHKALIPLAAAGMVLGGAALVYKGGRK